MRICFGTHFKRGTFAGDPISVDGLELLHRITSHIYKQLEGSADSDDKRLARLIESMEYRCDADRESILGFDGNPHVMQVTAIATICIPVPGKSAATRKKVECFGEFCFINEDPNWANHFASHLLRMVIEEMLRQWRQAGIKREKGLKEFRE
ncbi:MAG: hypothetical protein Q8Q36_00910, partial [bacterium]|nr:hypothetical protein [bacterium]